MNAILTTPQTQRITLYYREGSSDKVYQAASNPKAKALSSTSPMAAEDRR